jgi:exonuclease III
MRFVTWNVAGRVTRQPEQLAALAGLGADVVALQEVTKHTLPAWRAGLEELGLPEVACPLDDGPPPKPRRLAVLTAARAPLHPASGPSGLPWPERVLVNRVEGILVVNVHSPISPAPDLAKVLTHEAVHAHLAALPPGPVVLCGDLNTPRREHGPGDVLTFAHDSRGRLRPERGERWAAAERALVIGLAEHGFADAFRTLHGYGAREASWTFPGGKGGWRIDHVLVRGLRVDGAAYAHAWRDSGLSDHAPLVADLGGPLEDGGS